MHYYRNETIHEKMDDIAVRDLYLMIAHLQGKLTFEQLVSSSRSNPRYMTERLQLATEVAMMFHQNEEVETGLLNGKITNDQIDIK